ncbi:hypothetical protein BG011_005446 [Mortierella polycephala]|uniref:Spindle pole body component n=1 Tax=Mortierella polycephala TaxID=41804 RepID=A0A9P6U1A2_9FUNG|nr:hypothetical protein BG011_005446 [Mortierella polycephala]
MQDLDPASLLFIPRDEYAPLTLDPALFESVGDGVSSKMFTAPNPDAPPPLPEPLERLKTLAAQFDPTADHDTLASESGSKEAAESDAQRIPMTSAVVWESSWKYELDQRVLEINRPSIFDTFHDPTKSRIVGDEGSLSSFSSDSSSQESVSATQSQESGVDHFTRWSKRTLFGSLSHPAGQESLSSKQPLDTRDTVDVDFELPPLTKRPRDILDECAGNEASVGAGLPKGQKSEHQVRSAKAAKVHVTEPWSRLDTWSAAGKPLQQDTAVATRTREPASASTIVPDKLQLTWEMCSRYGPAVSPKKDIISPYVTEAGTRVFEAVYHKHMDYAYKFRPMPPTISREKLVDCMFLLLGGTASSVFTYNTKTLRFEMDAENVRIKGCSTLSLTSMLQDMMDAGTHMRRLVSMADTCINHPEGVGLIRIAFGRSLSSYLTFLQGSIVALQEASQERPTRILELYHKTHDMTVTLERLAHLCRCHISQDISDASLAYFGFHLPAGPDLLSMIYEHVQKLPVTNDPLWTALLLSILDQASKPYRDILSRWMGITPSVYDEEMPSAQQPQINGNPSQRTSTSIEQADATEFSIFDCHLQQSLQHLDPFGELFIHSKHGWSWDGSELIILGEPLDYEDEFRMHPSVKPAGFIDGQLADRILEAGKELQILVEFESRHPLIAHDRNFKETKNELAWFYVQKDITKHRIQSTKARNEVLHALAARLENMCWVAKRSIRTMKKDQKGKARALDRDMDQDQGLNHAGSTDTMDVDVNDQGALHNIGAQATSVASLELDLNPELQGFFALSSTLVHTSNISLACPDMMAFLLGPSSSSEFTPSSSTVPLHTFSRNEPIEANHGPSTATHPGSMSTMPSSRSRLETMAPLTVLAGQSLRYSIRARASLINTCVMSLYFHDMNLLGHLDIMERFFLMRDGHFIARLEEALFEEEMGLLSRCAQGTNEPQAARTTVSEGGSGDFPLNNDRRDSIVSIVSNASASSMSAWKNAKYQWPPRSGELEMTLTAVLLDCFQFSESHFEDARDLDDASEFEASDMEAEKDDQGQFLQTGEKCGPLQRPLDAKELEDSLAFAVKEYDDHTKICTDANALEALDFLYLDYKAPRPLRLLIFTPSAFEKYTRLFAFQLRLTRIDSTLKNVFRKLRTRQKSLSSISSAGSYGDGEQQYLQALKVEMDMLHRFRFEAQQIFSGFRGYIMDVAMGETWKQFMDRLRNVQAGLEDRILNCAESLDDDGDDDSDSDVDDHLDEGGELKDLAALNRYHDYILDRMLLQSLLKLKQAPILKVVHGILNSILRLARFVSSLPDLSELSLFIDEGTLHARLAKLQKLQDKFRATCQMLIKVLKVLDERGIGIEGVTKNKEPSTTDPGYRQHGYLQQLLLRLDMSGFNDN